MKITWWQKLLSQFSDVPVVHTSSPYNEALSVVIRYGRYQLCTANAIYSYGDLYDNFSQVFRQLDWEKFEARNVLLLGLGLASIPYMLEKKFHKSFDYTAVEIDPVILQLANTFVLPEIKSPLTAYNTDAAVFVATCTDTYDLICMDIFQDDQVPEYFESPEFLESLKECLSDSGVLLFNRLATTAADREQSVQYFEETFKSIFPGAIWLDTGGNYMLVNEGSFLKQ